MKTVLLSMLFAAAVATTASAASTKHTHHHHHVTHVAHASTASTSDWPGNPYMDLKPSQVSRFWHDALDPYDATAK